MGTHKSISRTKKLIERFWRGNEQAFYDLYALYFQHTFYISLQMLGNQDRALEAAHETFKRVYSGLDKLDRPEAFPKWIRTISRNVCFDMKRSQQKEADHMEDGYDLEAMAETAQSEEQGLLTENGSADQELQETVARMVYALPNAQKEAVLLYYFDGFSGDEIAEITNATPSAVRRRLSYARDTLREQFCKEGMGSLSRVKANEDQALGATVSAGLIANAERFAASSIEMQTKARLLQTLGNPLKATEPVRQGSIALRKSSVLKMAMAIGLSISVGAGTAVWSRNARADMPSGLSLSNRRVFSLPGIRDIERAALGPAIHVVADPAATSAGVPETEVSPGAVPARSNLLLPLSPPAGAQEKQRSVQPGPYIATGTAFLTYSTGSVVLQDQIISDADVFAVDSTGNKVSISVYGYEAVDFETQGVYLIDIDAQDAHGKKAKTKTLQITIR